MAPCAHPPISLAPFRQADAQSLVNWVPNEATLRLLAPLTEPPLTVERVLQWRMPHGHQIVGRIRDNADSHPPPGSMVAYGELNPLEREPGRYWLGHCIVDPSFRGMGLGTAFVRSLLARAFSELAAKRVSLIVFPDNEPAVRCYLAAGFHAAGDEWHDFHHGSRERLLRLDAVDVAGN